MKTYLAGPMTGLPDDNRPAFNAAARRLRAALREVINPAELDDSNGQCRTWAEYLARDMPHVLHCDELALLPNWEHSRGARLEAFAAVTCGLPIIEATSLVAIPVSTVMRAIAKAYPDTARNETILDEAKRLTATDRNADYGHPADDYGRTAKLWSGILGCDVTPRQAILCMVAVKISRECNKPKRDNRVDMAGYAQCLDMVEQRIGPSR